MSLPSQQSSATYAGNNSAVTPYPITFKFFTASDIVVTLTDIAGLVTILVPVTDYAVTGGDSEVGATGSLTTTLPIVATTAVLIERTVDIEQETELTDLGKFPSQAVERAFDYLTMVCQQIARGFANIFATVQQTLDGTVTNRATTPAGVRAAIQAASLPGYDLPLIVELGGTGGTDPASAIQSLIPNPDNFTIGTNATVNFVFTGDSLTTDVAPASGSGNSYPQQVMQMSRFRNQGAYYNVAVAGRTLAQVDAAYMTEIYPHRPTGSVVKSYIIMPIGTNGFRDYGTPAAFVAALEAFIDKVHGHCFEFVGFSIMRNASSIDFEAFLQAVNKGLRQSGKPDIFIDWAAWFPSPYESHFFVDQTHLNALGNKITALRLNSAMEQVGNVAASPNPGFNNVGQFGIDSRQLPSLLGPRNGVRGSAAGTQCFLYGALTDPGTGDYTVGFWIYWISGQSLAVGKAGQIGFGVSADGHAYFEGGGRTGGYTSVIPIISRQWTHLVFSKNGSGVAISANGVRSDVDSTATGTTQAPNRILIPGNSINFFVADVFWYSKSLQRGEVEWIYQNGGIPVDTTNLEIFIPCDEGIGNQLRDEGVNQFAFEPQAGTGTLVWANAETRKTFKYYNQFVHSGVSSTAATTALVTLPKNCKVVSFDWSFSSAFDAGVTLDVGITGTGNKFISGRAADITGLAYNDSTSKVVESTSSSTQVWIKKSGATTTGAFTVVITLEAIGLAQ